MIPTASSTFPTWCSFTSGACEAGGDDEGIAGLELLRLAVGAGEDDAAGEDAAELVLGIGDAPFAGRALPDAGKELSGVVAEVVLQPRRRVARDDVAGLAGLDRRRIGSEAHHLHGCHAQSPSCCRCYP